VEAAEFGHDFDTMILTKSFGIRVSLAGLAACAFALTMLIPGLTTPGAAADPIAGLDGGRGTLIVTQLVSAPFPHPDRSGGHRYQDQFFPAEKHYQDSTVGIFIPKGFKPGEETDLVVHFHGWRNHVAREIVDYRLIEQFAESGRNAILVLPQGPRDAPDSFAGKMEDEGGFKRLIDEVMAVLHARTVAQKARVGRIILSGHSGAYRAMAYSLAVGGLADHVKEVWLFDALYAEREKFSDWQKKTKGRLINIYTADGGTKKETDRWISDLRAEGTSCLVADEEKARSTDLRGQRLVFLFTKLQHNEVIHKHRTFQMFLERSELNPRPDFLRGP
jgi:hypothetical protein